MSPDPLRSKVKQQLTNNLGEAEPTLRLLPTESKGRLTGIRRRLMKALGGPEPRMQVLAKLRQSHTKLLEAMRSFEVVNETETKEYQMLVAVHVSEGQKSETGTLPTPGGGLSSLSSKPSQLDNGVKALGNTVASLSVGKKG
ncbi:hypothetical protein IMZ48_21025 [Candidatus Bathyarchaeota archaeon]|nr:hypothetical protein [Candidatus Bathyarchaeota archaeon]